MTRRSQRPEAPLSEQFAITRVVTVAGGRFAPGHIGELTQLVPFEMVDEALKATGRVQVRLRDLPVSLHGLGASLRRCGMDELTGPRPWPPH